jgi:nucleoside-diphosphate-sugar epimerase
MKRVFITGATGEIGKILLSKIVQKYDVTALYRGEKPSFISNVEWVKGNLLNTETFADKLEKADAIVHVAALLRSNNWEELYKTNAEATKKLLEIAKEKKCKKAVVFSSASVTQKWLTPYAKSKKEMEKIIQEMDFNTVIIRPTLVYQKNSRYLKSLERITLSFLPFIPLPNNGRANMQPVHVNDVVETVLAVLKKYPEEKKVFDVAPEGKFTLCELTQVIAEKNNVRKKCFSPIPKSIVSLFQKLADRNIPIPKPFISWASASNSYQIDPKPLLTSYKLDFVPAKKGIKESLE